MTNKNSCGKILCIQENKENMKRITKYTLNPNIENKFDVTYRKVLYYYKIHVKMYKMYSRISIYNTSTFKIY